jgi:hypothetical protein
MSETIITRQYLIDHPNEIFVFGDNLLRKGKGGAAALRDLPNTYGFITKKAPNSWDKSFYDPNEYRPVFIAELAVLINKIKKDLNAYDYDKLYLISKLGSGLANKYGIWENVIKDGLEILRQYPNVRFLYD